MLRKVSLILALLLLPSLTYAQTGACDNPARVKSVAINLSSATTTRLVNNTSTEASIVVCGFTVTVDGNATPNQISYISGTGSTCGTATVTLTGTFRSAGAAATVLVITSGTIPFGIVTLGQSLCVITSQASTVQGILTYVLM